MRLFILALLSLFAIAQPAFAETTLTRAARALAEDSAAYGARLASSSGDKLTLDIYRWMHIIRKPDDFSFQQISDFHASHADWPGQDDMRRAAERRISASGLAPASIVSWFKANPPLTGEGMLRYLDALAQTGQTGRIEAVLKPWWETALLRQEDQSAIYQKYGSALDRSTHARRMSFLLNKDYETTALRMAQALGPAYVSLAQARIGLAKEAGNADALVANVPSSLRNDTGLMYERLKYRRKKNNNAGMIELLNAQPRLGGDDRAEDWWRERHILIRRLIEQKDYRKAYNLAAKHNLDDKLSGAAEAEFLAGWLALRFMKEPAKGFAHFEHMYKIVSSPISKARGAYWAGRAAEAAGQKDIAQQWMQVAARRSQTYYGQKANETLPTGQRVAIQRYAQVSDATLGLIKNSELGRAAALTHRSGLDSESRRFMSAIGLQADTAEKYAALAKFATELELRTDAIRISKDAARKGFYLAEFAYPKLTRNPTTHGANIHLVHAVIRQESEFNPQAVSGVGARGLMQLMPATAQSTARSLGLKYEISTLTSQPYYNVQLGSAYLQSLVERFDGALPMALAGYNAGPSRVNQWIETFGDPRTGQIDWIDWIELIPISETRNYVQRCLEGYEIYRTRG